MVERFEQFSFSISSIYRNIQKIEREEMERYGCRGAFARYLVAMNRFPDGVTSAELCDICDRDKAAVSRIVFEMEEKGLIERKLRQGSYYRAKLVLTEEGKKAAQFVCERASAAVGATSGVIADTDRKNMYEALAIIAENLQTIAKKGIPEKE